MVARAGNLAPGRVGICIPITCNKQNYGKLQTMCDDVLRATEVYGSVLCAMRPRASHPDQVGGGFPATGH